jgi:predicted house-cleaning noncanonical NTP pyrophosphatase (MazG superfamily)
MAKIIYNKLIRDLIPEKIRAKGSDCETRELSAEEFRKELLRKAEEEASAFGQNLGRAEFLDELADLEIVLREFDRQRILPPLLICDHAENLKRANNVTAEEMAHAVEQNLARKGGFEKRLFLVWSSDDGYRTNERTVA